jgi:hypothetical protein
MKMPAPLVSSVIDFAALNKEDQPILIGEAKIGQVEEEDRAQMSASLRMLAHVVPFAMLADPEQIQIFRWDGKDLSPPVAVLRTPEVLRQYEPEFEERRVFERYLIALIAAWLRDLAYHWKLQTPPGSEELKKIGLLDKLADGTTLPEVEIIGGHLRSVR